MLRYQPILFDANYHGLNAVASTEIRARCGVQAAVLTYQPILSLADHQFVQSPNSTSGFGKYVRASAPCVQKFE